MKSASARYFELMTEDYPRGTRWLRFHTFWRLPCGGVLSALVALVSLVSIIANYPHAEFYLFANTIFNAAFALIALLAIVPTRWLEPRGFFLNISLCVTKIVSNFLFIVMMDAGLLAFDDVSGATSIIISICEIIYFMKRKDLFYSAQNQPYEEYVTPQEDVPACDADVKCSPSRENNHGESRVHGGIYSEDVMLAPAPAAGTAPSIDDTSHKNETASAEENILALEKAYARIDKFHDYFERGVITQEEYEESRRKILEALE